MFFSVLDENSATLVGKYEGRVQTDADYERCLAAIHRGDACAVARGVPYVCVLITRPRPGHQLKAFDTVASAAEWIRATTGRPYPEIERLQAALERETAVHAANA